MFNRRIMSKIHGLGLFISFCFPFVLFRFIASAPSSNWKDFSIQESLTEIGDKRRGQKYSSSFLFHHTLSWKVLPSLGMDDKKKSHEENILNNVEPDELSRHLKDLFWF